MTKLQIELKLLPKKPGVYWFKNKAGKIIYIGKALSLKHRVKSYFQQKDLDQKTQLLLEQIADLDFQIVPSEFEALLLEAQLIKKYQPKYNLRLKDDKRFLYIGITRSPYRIFPMRRPELEKDLLDWFGPFPSAGSVRQVLRIMRRIFPFCSCRKPPKRQCLYSHLNLCPGFKNLTSKKYQADIIQIRHTLNGKTKSILKNLKKKMFAAAKKLEFEKAARYKKQIGSLEYITQGWKPISEFEDTASIALLNLRKLLVKYQGLSPTILNKIEGYDVSNLGKNIIAGAMVTFVDGQPEKGLYRKFKIKLPWSRGGDQHGRQRFFETAHRIHKVKPKIEPHQWMKTLKQEKKDAWRPTVSSDPGSIRQIISRRLNHPEWLYPQLILVDGGKGQVSAVLQALREKNLADQICVLGLAKKKETIVVPRIKNGRIAGWKLLNYSSRNPVLKLLQQIRDESHRFAQKYYRHLHWRKTTGF